ncbi:SAM-dependent methyltransferase [Actinoplanes lutulentus]|uniref:Hydroxyneurosporene-O-methyltransferase n=1 Tax=Actinoplanes lutulentus TaxID=1287878 RepID=A0A327ZJ85_9ACTN|nr:methyltransferase [Actinoplanes lutulentus]MBB2942692.1 SAM-dependent methyltransferase [Actinoplanes lutulentus]RAK38273.1 hydroxyneurosporene-O-methyltransferase [Actinoplanes lutulentus]
MNQDNNAQLRRKIMGYLVSQAIFAVCELGVPDRLAAGPMPLPELARDRGADPDALRRFLRVLAGEGLFTEPAPDLFALAELGELLCTGADGSLHHLAGLMSGEAYQAWGAAPYSVRTGAAGFDQVYGMPYFAWLAENPAEAERFDQGQAGLVEVRLLPLLDRDWSGVTSVVDVGGGNGMLLARLAARHPHLTGVVFDLPHVVESAGPALTEVADRVGTAGGDFFDKVPPGADAYVLSQILHDWNDERAGVILANCRQAMPGNGRLFIVEQILDPDAGSGPAALLDLHMLVLLGGRERTRADWERLLHETGFVLESVTAGPRSSLLTARPRTS